MILQNNENKFGPGGGAWIPHFSTVWRKTNRNSADLFSLNGENQKSPSNHETECSTCADCSSKAFALHGFFQSWKSQFNSCIRNCSFYSDEDFAEPIFHDFSSVCGDHRQWPQRLFPTPLVFLHKQFRMNQSLMTIMTLGDFDSSINISSLGWPHIHERHWNFVLHGFRDVHSKGNWSFQRLKQQFRRGLRMQFRDLRLNDFLRRCREMGEQVFIPRCGWKCGSG
jgi:hypothetical protein